MSTEGTVTLSRCGREFCLQLSRSYTAAQLGRMFNVDPNTLWLRETYSNRVYFPSSDGTFDLKAEGAEAFSEITVEGDAYSGSGNRPAAPSTATLSATGVGSSSNTSNSMLSSYPSFTSVVSSHGRRGSNGGGSNLKVVQAEISGFSAGRPEFRRLGQTFIPLSDSTANIHHVTSVVKAEFGDEYVVVTADDLEVRDSAGTRGTK